VVGLLCEGPGDCGKDEGIDPWSNSARLRTPQNGGERAAIRFFHHAPRLADTPYPGEARRVGEPWWARQDLNLQPHRYERRAMSILTRKYVDNQLVEASDRP
jgi:hypothetical protein